MKLNFGFLGRERRIIDRPIDRLLGQDGTFRALPTQASVECKPFPIFGRAGFSLNMRRPLPARSVSTIKNAIVHGQSAALFTLKRLNKAVHWAALPELSLDLYAANYSPFFEKVVGGWRFSPAPDLSPSRSIGRGVLIGSRFSFNYFHFATDSLIRALIADSALGVSDWPVVITETVPQISQLIRMLFPGREIMSLASDELVQFEELIVPISSSFSPDDPLETPKSVLDAPYLKELRLRLADSNGKNASERSRILYIKRPHYVSPEGVLARTIFNQDEVIEFVQQMGATVVSPENLNVETQRQLFGNADIVIGMAGSALANTIFCRPGASVILICQDEIVSPEYFGLMFGELGLTYAVVACPAIANSNPHPAHRSVTVDIAALRQALEFVVSKQHVVT